MPEQSNVSIGLSDPKSPANVGSILRAAGNYRAANIFYTGERYDRALRLNPDRPNLARKVSEGVTLSLVDSLIDAAPQGAKIVCVEFAVNAISLPLYQHPENAYYIFGPEDGSIDQAVIDRADAVVYVPTIGSMNLAATVSVLLYDRLAKMSQHLGSNELILKNRDTNNNLKVKHE